MAMATASGVDELRSGVLGRGSRGRGREQRVRERSEGDQGAAWRRGGVQVLGGKQEVACGGRARAGVRWPRTSVLLEEEGEDTGAPGGLGRPDGAVPGKWRQVSCPGGLLSLSIYFCSVFLLFNSFATVLNLK